MPGDRLKRLIALGIFVGFAAIVVMVVRGDRKVDPDWRPVATVDGHPIGVARFNREYVNRLLTTGRNDTPVERWATLDNLIQVRLLAEEARRRGLDSSRKFREHVQRQRLLAAGNAFFMREFGETLPPLTEEQVRTAYRNSHDQVVLRHLFFRDPRKAELAWRLLQEGEDFVDLANEIYDTPAWDSSAGMLGTASYWDLDDAVAEAAYALAPGEISKPVRSRYGWHVLRLENRIRNPLLIEEDFQRRRESIAGRYEIRRNRVGGDQWVRGFMERLDPRVDTLTARLVVEALAPVTEGVKVDTEVRIRDQEVEEVREELEPGSPLVTYTLDGVERTFTAGDFVRWLPVLPFEEVRERPMAAVGRALRNEAMGLMGLSEGLDGEQRASEAIDFASDVFLADTLRGLLRVSGSVVPTDDDIAEAFDRLNLGALSEATGDWWSIPFPTYAAAQHAQRSIAAGERGPESWPAFESVSGGDLLASELGSHLRRMPLAEPLVVCTADGSCSVARIDERTLVRTTIDEKREELRSLLMRILPEERLTDSLFAIADVQVDTTLFRQLMERK